MEMFKKRILTVIITFAFALTCGNYITCFADNTTTSNKCGDNITWSYSENTKTLTLNGYGAMNFLGYQSPFKNYNIKRIVMVGEITSISSYAFSECKNLSQIIMPDSISNIESYAFNDCVSLKNITLPAKLSSYNSYIFNGCISLESINVSNTLGFFQSDNGVLLNYNKTEIIMCPCAKSGEYTIPNTVTTISSDAFKNCIKLTKITIPNSVTKICDQAFSQCYSLTNINIPKNLTSIGDDNFSKCLSLNNITVDSDNSYFYSDNGVIIDSANKSILKCPATKQGQYTVPDNILSINACAFQNCSLLTDIVLNSRLVSIGDSAFENCTGITSITMPNSVSNIGMSVFSGCENLVNVQLSTGITCISDAIFYNCKKLTNFTIPNGITTIDFEAFYNCAGLTEITIPSSVTKIANDAFTESYNLININVDEGNKNFCSASGVLFNNNATSLLFCPNGKTGKYIIPDTVTTIEYQAFAYCNALTQIIIPDSVETITMLAFYNCSGLTEIEIPSKVSTLDLAFEDCENLININVDKLNSTFASLNGILYTKDMKQLIYCPIKNATTCTMPQTISQNNDYPFVNRNLTALNISKDITDFDPQILQENKFTAINVDPENAVYSSIDGVLYNKDKTQLIMYPGKKSGSLNISKTVTDITDYAFIGCTGISEIAVDNLNNYFTVENGVLFDKNKTNILCCSKSKTGKYVIPDSVRFVSNAAFNNCDELTEIVINNNILSMPISTYANCKGLEKLRLTSYTPNNLLLDLNGSTNLSQLIISDKVSNIYIDCKINKNITIYCYDKSYAYYYAKQNNIPFVLMKNLNGDINDDGKIAASDIIEMKKAILYEPFDIDQADLNNDNTVDIRDLIHLKKICTE